MKRSAGEQGKGKRPGRAFWGDYLGKRLGLSLAAKVIASFVFADANFDGTRGKDGTKPFGADWVAGQVGTSRSTAQRAINELVGVGDLRRMGTTPVKRGKANVYAADGLLLAVIQGSTVPAGGRGTAPKTASTAPTGGHNTGTPLEQGVPQKVTTEQNPDVDAGRDPDVGDRATVQQNKSKGATKEEPAGQGTPTSLDAEPASGMTPNATVPTSGQGQRCQEVCCAGAVVVEVVKFGTGKHGDPFVTLRLDAEPTPVLFGGYGPGDFPVGTRMTYTTLQADRGLRGKDPQIVTDTPAEVAHRLTSGFWANAQAARDGSPTWRGLGPGADWDALGLDVQTAIALELSLSDPGVSEAYERGWAHRNAHPELGGDAAAGT